MLNKSDIIVNIEIAIEALLLFDILKLFCFYQYSIAVQHSVCAYVQDIIVINTSVLDEHTRHRNQNPIRS